jgi:hypothetical protein
MNDQDSNSYAGNMLRFALHRQGQNSQVCTRSRAMGYGGEHWHCQTVPDLVIAQQD